MKALILWYINKTENAIQSQDSWTRGNLAKTMNWEPICCKNFTSTFLLNKGLWKVLESALRNYTNYEVCNLWTSEYTKLFQNHWDILVVKRYSSTLLLKGTSCETFLIVPNLCETSFAEILCINLEHSFLDCDLTWFLSLKYYCLNTV